MQQYKDQAIDIHYDVDKTQKHCAEWENSDTGEHILHDSTYTKCPEKANL